MEPAARRASSLNLMNNKQLEDLCLKLLRADTEHDVIEILKGAGLWDNSDAWRLYGDKEGNFAQAGNQQAQPEAALVEKIVNCCDARLMSECLKRGINPESSDAPRNVRDGVAMFFENRRAEHEEAGTLRNWASEKRTQESRFITLAATGGRPTRGHRAANMCITVADQGEGQSGQRLPDTILSLNAKNKQRIRFVQGKFNMGGSGVHYDFAGHPDFSSSFLNGIPSSRGANTPVIRLWISGRSQWCAGKSRALRVVNRSIPSSRT